MVKKYPVNLSVEERSFLLHVVKCVRENSERVKKRALALLLAHEGWSDREISDKIGIGTATVERLRKGFCSRGVDVIRHRRSKGRRRRKVDARVREFMIRLATSPPPAGRRRWSLRLLAKEASRSDQLPISSISHESVRMILNGMSSEAARKRADCLVLDPCGENGQDGRSTARE